MCGICGMVRFSGSGRPDPGLLQRMSDALAHRGPDGVGVFVDGPIAMANTRLAVIDIQGGDQPLESEDGQVQVIQNGEIYNHEQLAGDLRRLGHTLKTHSDTEVIAHLYEEYGSDFARHLRGMFAAVVWDRKRQRLLIARDRFGIKPVYYREKNGVLSFASELKSLILQPDFSREIDTRALEAYLATNFVPTPMTIFRDAKKLEAGHVLICDGGVVTSRRFADPRPAQTDQLLCAGTGDLREELLRRLRGSVKAHLVSDVPVGVMLSGGIDSGALVALAAESSRDPIKTFTIGFKESGFSEVEPARAVARRYGTDHHELVVEPGAVDLLPTIIETFDEPFADNAALPTYLVSQMASEEVKVVLSGEGADELFGGYYSYTGDLWAPRVGRAATLLRPLIDRLPSGTSSLRLDDRLKRFARGSHLPQPDRHVAWSQIFAPDLRREIVAERADDGFDPLDIYRERWSGSAGAESVSRAQDLDLGIYMVDDILVKIDRASMAHGLESRVPYLDTEVSDFALALPTREKVTRLTKKKLFRETVAPLLPDAVASAPKRGFVLPVAGWFRGPLVPLMDEVLSPQKVRAQGLLDPEVVTSVIRSHRSGREDMSRNIWGLVCLSLWHDRYVGSST